MRAATITKACPFGPLLYDQWISWMQQRVDLFSFSHTSIKYLGALFFPAAEASGVPTERASVQGWRCAITTRRRRWWRPRGCWRSQSTRPSQTSRALARLRRLIRRRRRRTRQRHRRCRREGVIVPLVSIPGVKKNLTPQKQMALEAVKKMLTEG